MKKFLKTLLIIVLVCVSVGGTAYFFFSHLNKDVDYFEELNFYVNGSENAEMLGSLDNVYDLTFNSKLNSVKDRRFGLIVDTNNLLDTSLKSLSSYLLVADEHKFKDKDISSNFVELKNKRVVVENAMDEFESKSRGGNFNPSTEADSIYSAFADYFVCYAQFLKHFESKLGVFKLATNADLKFSIIELYSDICINTFSSLTKKNALVEVKADENISYINSKLSFNNNFVNTGKTDGFGSDDFSHLNNLFVKNYNSSNKQTLANNLFSLCNQVGTNLNNDVIKNYGYEQLSAVYFNCIFKVV